MPVTLVPNGEVLIAQNLTDIPVVFERMTTTRLPGFQIAPEVDLNDSLQVLRGLMRMYDPSFAFTDITGPKNPTVKDEPAHVDSYYAARIAGIALHENITGSGGVVLQLLKPDVVDAVRADDFVGPCLAGDLRPNMKTVFSQGLFDVASRAFILGATYHSFTNGGTTPRDWRRHTHHGLRHVADY